MNDIIELEVGGIRHSGWKEADVQTGLDRFAGAFNLSLVDKWPDEEGFELERLSVEAGQSAAIYVGGELVMSGYIDKALPAINSDEYSIQIAGRSMAADLLDCSAVHEPATWLNQKLEDIVRDIIAPFRIDVIVQTDTGEAFKKFAIQQGESVFDVIERMCQMRALLPVSAANGDIIIMRPSLGESVSIREGADFTSAEAQHDVSGRYSDYIVKGQSAGDDDHNGRATNQLTGRAIDPAVMRYRPLLIIAEEQGNSSTMAQRAEWEVKVRAAQSQSAIINYPDWRAPNGQLWRDGMSVDLFAPSLFITDMMIVTGVNFTVNADVKEAVIALAYPDAYAQLPTADADAARIERQRA